jgi:SnoaL-like polyketide cyclase
VSLFRRNKKKIEVEEESEQVDLDMDPLKDPGLVGLYYRILTEVEEDFGKAVTTHLERIHEPGGYAREKREHDFMELGMKRDYLDALDDIEFTVDEVIASVQVGLKKRGTATLVTRWTVRGLHTRPLNGLPPSGEQMTVEGLTYTTFRNYNIRVEYSFWQTPELTRRMVER